ncbi:hypothetical protein Pcinc_031203 [Petrolisthes cinctipes]|uniref:Osteoclast-stimulating factor 1 n=1 Tax=Petrolisthes cinctipes TaxID=88211 RepID=A0AAE1K568_PETCI|nr:hypothetical protein Pcinc_031203 [Petrolisthes cinctipes]
MSVPTRVAPPPPPVRKGQVQSFEAICQYKAQRDCELSFEEGDLLFITDRTDPTWWQAILDNKKGYVRSEHVTKDGVKVAIVDAARRAYKYPYTLCISLETHNNLLSVTKDGVKVAIVDAARRGNLELMEECLKAGVSVNSLDKSGCSPLHAAAQAGHRNCVDRLVQDTRIQVNLQNKLGDTPLHCAAYRGHAEVVQLLLKMGARIDIVNKDNCTPRGLAKKPNIISILEESIVKNNRRKSSCYDDLEYGATYSDDSDD